MRKRGTKKALPQENAASKLSRPLCEQRLLAEAATVPEHSLAPAPQALEASHLSGCLVALRETLDRESIPARLRSSAALSVLAVPASPFVAAALAAARAASAACAAGVWAWGGVEGGPVRLSHVASRSNGHFPSASASGSPNSCLDTVPLVEVQKATSYNLDKVVAPNPRRKRGAAVRSGQGQLRRPQMCRQPRLPEHIRAQPALCMTVPSPGCGTGTRSGTVRGVSGRAAVSLVMPPGRHQFAPQSLGWTRVCGTERSGVGC